MRLLQKHLLTTKLSYHLVVPVVTLIHENVRKDCVTVDQGRSFVCPPPCRDRAAWWKFFFQIVLSIRSFNPRLHGEYA